MRATVWYGLTQLGIAHTALSLLAVAAGVWAFARQREITAGNGPGHVLAVMTLVAPAAGMVAARTRLSGGASRAAQAIAFSSTAFFHAIPGVMASLTRPPHGDPLLAVALYFQLRWIRRGAA